jgi:hypothetical protein
MKEKQAQSLPRWVFVCLAVGASWASGLYLGMLMVEGSSTAYLIRIIGFGVVGLVMAWGAAAKRTIG